VIFRVFGLDPEDHLCSLPGSKGYSYITIRNCTTMLLILPQIVNADI